ncbi:MAG: (E)-4-hydroxy-3-methylbut-2-enyl-diphosphate synthase [Bacilli bacterium]
MNKLSFSIGNKIIGSGHDILIQSMSDRKTSDIDYNVKLTSDLEKMGLDMMRFSVLDHEDALLIGEIKKQVNIPIIADIHFDYTLALQSIQSGVDKIRINPGNIGGEVRLRQVINACREKNIPIRIGVNSGSLNAYRGKTDNQADDFLLAMDETISVFESENFENLVLSLKSSSPSLSEELYLKANERYKYPLHIGLTESGYGTIGSIKSAVTLFPLLSKGIGDTIRVSLADERKEEMRAVKTLLGLSGRKSNIPELIVCPSCGRTQIDLKPIAREVNDHLDYVFKNIKVAVMGCPVNGIGEAKDADYGIAGSGKKDVYLLFSKGKPLGLYNKKEAVARLFSLIDSF